MFFSKTFDTTAELNVDYALVTDVPPGLYLVEAVAFKTGSDSPVFALLAEQCVGAPPSIAPTGAGVRLCALVSVKDEGAVLCRLSGEALSSGATLRVAGAYRLVG